MTTVTRTTTVPVNGAGVGDGPAPSKVVGDQISHEEFIEMLDIIEAMDQHYHNYKDTYTTNCECQCGGGGQI